MTLIAPSTRLTAGFDPLRPDGLPGVIPYVTAGYPRRDDTVPLLLAAERAGCAAVEVGIPFSDPLADGPTIQRTGWRALQNGMTLRLALEQVREARSSGLRLPVVVMTYLNPVLAHGVDRFTAGACDCGVDGVIVPDLPADEAPQLRAALAPAGLPLIPLVAPTTPDARLSRVLQAAAGFVYCVGVVGVTGAREALAPEALELLERARLRTPLPRALGFGISSVGQVAALAGQAEAVVVGSALLDAIGRDEDEPAAAAEAFLLRLTPPG